MRARIAMILVERVKSHQKLVVRSTDFRDYDFSWARFGASLMLAMRVTRNNSDKWVEEASQRGSANIFNA